MSLKGNAIVMGDKEEIDTTLKDFEQKKTPPQIVVQSISTWFSSNPHCLTNPKHSSTDSAAPNR
jgi:hypothetical protein